MVVDNVKVCAVCHKVGMKEKGFLYLGKMDVCKNCLVHLIAEELRRQESGQRKSKAN